MNQPSSSLLHARRATLKNLAQLLTRQHAAKLDVVTPARALRCEDGRLRLPGAGPAVLSESGVSCGEVSLRPTAGAEADIAAKLVIPIRYLRVLRERGLVGLYDQNVTTLLAADPRRFLVRGLLDEQEGEGVVRALLGSGFRIVDNLDVLTAMLSGIRDSGAVVQVTQCDLSERRMYVKVRCEALGQYAPALLSDYTSPFTGARGADNPLVFPGFVVGNSETGDSSFSITPQLTVQICDNGMTMTKDIVREVHRGGRLADGVIHWSGETQDTALRLVAQQTRDAVKTFLDPRFVRAKIAEIEAEAGVAITNPAATLEHVATELRFTTAQREQVLGHFIQGGDLTSGGVMHAVTSACQLVEDPDTAYEMEATGLRAMHLAAVHAA